MSEYRNRSSPGNGINKAIDNITPEELVEFREAFRVFDQDGDVRKKDFLDHFYPIFIFQGSITLAGCFFFSFLSMIILIIELRVVLDQMGLDPTEEELQDMISEVDEDQSGSISFIEFVGEKK
jgi:Ca2+-binding EF-hand superfamily protein